jgi:CheY-like chemotaxis protein
VALLVGAIQGLVIAVGWFAMVQTTHEQVASGVERIIVQNNELMTRSVVDAVGDLDEDLALGSVAWERVQDIIERVELGKGGFACVVDAEGFIVCHPELRTNPGLAEVDLSEHAFALRGSGDELPLEALPAAGVASGSMDFLLDGRHYVASQALGGGGARLLVHRPASGLTAARTHLTRGLVLQTVGMGVIIVGLTVLIVFLITRAHNAALLCWNEELDEKVAERTSQLQDALGDARATAQAQADCLASMSHEIRTPMSGVLGDVPEDASGQDDEAPRREPTDVRGAAREHAPLVAAASEDAFAAAEVPPVQRAPLPPRGDGPPVVLVVEDNFLNQKVAVAFLKRMGCHVRVAWDGSEAVDAVQIRPYDLVLMDCQMPVMDGLEATRRIRQLPGSEAGVPIVALTAHALPGDKEQGLAAGMDDYLVKPIAYEVLQAAVDRWAGLVPVPPPA